VVEAEEDASQADIGSVSVANTMQRFNVQTFGGKTVVSDLSSMAQEHAQQCLLTRCITRKVFPYKKFITLDSELDFGGTLQKRICYKLNVRHDPEGYWERNRESVRVKLMKKRNNTTESIRKKMEGEQIIVQLVQTTNKANTCLDTKCPKNSFIQETRITANGPY
jgi:hypothetical protein